MVAKPQKTEFLGFSCCHPHIPIVKNDEKRHLGGGGWQGAFLVSGLPCAGTLEALFFFEHKLDPLTS